MIADFDQLLAWLRHHDRALSPCAAEPTHDLPDDLPGPLADLYRKFGGVIRGSNVFSMQDQLLPLEHLKRFDDMIEFASENQGCWTCRCPAFREDPPVFCNWDTDEGPDEEFRQVAGLVQPGTERLYELIRS